MFPSKFSFKWHLLVSPHLCQPFFPFTGCHLSCIPWLLFFVFFQQSAPFSCRFTAALHVLECVFNQTFLQLFVTLSSIYPILMPRPCLCFVHYYSNSPFQGLCSLPFLCTYASLFADTWLVQFLLSVSLGFIHVSPFTVLKIFRIFMC